MSPVTAPVGCGPTTAIATRSHDQENPMAKKKVAKKPAKKVAKKGAKKAKK